MRDCRILPINLTAEIHHAGRRAAPFQMVYLPLGTCSAAMWDYYSAIVGSCARKQIVAAVRIITRILLYCTPRQGWATSPWERWIEEVRSIQYRVFRFNFGCRPARRYNIYNKANVKIYGSSIGYELLKDSVNALRSSALRALCSVIAIDGDIFVTVHC